MFIRPATQYKRTTIYLDYGFKETLNDFIFAEISKLNFFCGTCFWVSKRISWFPSWSKLFSMGFELLNTDTKKLTEEGY